MVLPHLPCSTKGLLVRKEKQKEQLSSPGLFPRRYELRRFQEDWGQRGVEDAPRTTAGSKREPMLALGAQEEIAPVELTIPLASARQLSYLFVKDPAHLEAKDH